MAQHIIRGLRGATKHIISHRPLIPIRDASKIFARNYVSEMERTAFREKILRLIRNEIEYELDCSPPSQLVPEFNAFKIDERPGEEFIRLSRKFGDTEEIKVEVTMFDGSIPVKKPGDDDSGDDIRLHITLIVDVFKGENRDILEFICSAWPDSIEIRKVFTRAHNQAKDKPYFGPLFKEFDDELQDSLYDFLETRGVDDDLAVFLHRYIANKDKVEYVRWMEKVKAFLQHSRN